MRALIVEHGSNRGALAASRALARAGWTVDLAGSGDSVTSDSRAVRHQTRLSFPEGGPEALVKAVSAAVREYGSDIIFPVDESQLLVLSRHRDELGALLPYPAHEVVERATDRLEQARAGEQAGLRPPTTTVDLPGHTGLVAVKARTPALMEREEGWSRFETSVGTREQAKQWIADLRDAGVEAVVQDVLTGTLASITILTDEEGKPLGVAQQQAERIWPPEAGTSARATTVPVDPGLRDRVVAFLDALGWRGLAQVQFLVDSAGGTHLIDFNPRFYGSLSLAIRAGVDFPVLWASSAAGRASPSNGGTARPGVRYHWLGGDIRRAIRERRGGLVRDIGGTLVFGAGAVHPIWSLRDPGPALRSSVGFLRRRL